MITISVSLYDAILLLLATGCLFTRMRTLHYKMALAVTGCKLCTGHEPYCQNSSYGQRVAPSRTHRCRHTHCIEFGKPFGAQSSTCRLISAHGSGDCNHGGCRD